MNNWVRQCNEWKTRWKNENDYFLKFKQENYFSIYEVMNVINSYSNSDNIIMTDAGSPSYVLPVNIELQKGQRIVSSPSQADMGWVLPASVGVALAAPEKRPIVLVGDGSFMSNIQELSVIREHNLPIKIAILNNNGYLSIRNTQKNFFGNRVYGVSKETGLHFPRFQDIARTFNINYVKIYHREIGGYDWIKTNFSDSNSYILEFMCVENEDIVPSQNFKMIDGQRVQCGLDDMFPFLPDDVFEYERNII